MKLQNLKISACLVCLLFIAGLSSSSFGDVLCISDNGHVEIESVCTPCCLENANSCFLSKADTAHDHHEGCDNCSDLSLDSPKLRIRNVSPEIDINHNVYLSTPAFGYDNSCTFSDIDLFDVELFPPISDLSSLMISTTIIIC